MSISRGQQNPAENYERITYSPTAGWSRQSGFTGPKAAVKAMLNELASQGLTFEYSCDQSPHATIRFETPGNPEVAGSEEVDESPSVNWEYFANRMEIDLLEGDISGANGTANINSITDAERKLLRNRLNGQEIVYPSSPSAAFASVYSLVEQGVRSVRVFVPTLRRSILVSASYPVKASLTNVGRLLTTNTLSSDESIPGTLLFNLPDYTSGKTGFVYAWYKNHPNIQSVGGGKWQISQEWDYGLWAEAMYGDAL